MKTFLKRAKKQIYHYLPSFVKAPYKKFKAKRAIRLRNAEIERRDSFQFPLVTVVVPVFNERRFVETCLRSVMHQSYRHLECIIVNDCSTDDSLEIAQSVIKNDPRFRIVRHETNSGLAASRNTGMKNALGEYITFLDSDDFLLHNSIWHRVDTLQKHIDDPEIMGVYCQIVPTPEDGTPEDLKNQHLVPVSASTVDFISSNAECPFNAHAPLLKVELFRKFGGFDESMRKGAEDWELWLRILRHGYRFVASNTYGAAYRQKKNSMVRRMPVDHLKEGARLIHSAFSPLAPEMFVEDVPYVYKQPLHYYQEAIILAQRVIRFATMVYLTDDKEGFQTALTYLDTDMGYYLPRHLNIRAAVNTSIVRFYGLGRKTDDTREMIDSKRDEIYAAIADYLGL